MCAHLSCSSPGWWTTARPCPSVSHVKETGRLESRWVHWRERKAIFSALNLDFPWFLDIPQMPIEVIWPRPKRRHVKCYLKIISFASMELRELTIWLEMSRTQNSPQVFSKYLENWDLSNWTNQRPGSFWRQPIRCFDFISLFTFRFDGKYSENWDLSHDFSVEKLKFEVQFLICIVNITMIYSLNFQSDESESVVHDYCC